MIFSWKNNLPQSAIDGGKSKEKNIWFLFSISISITSQQLPSNLMQSQIVQLIENWLDLARKLQNNHFQLRCQFSWKNI